MTYNQASGSINKQVLIDRLKLVQDRNTVFFENNYLIVVSPSIQNDSWWFDLLRGNVEKVHNSKKDGLLILRFFEKLLIAPLKDFLRKMVKEESVVKRQQGQENWKFNILEKNNGYLIINQKDRALEYPVQLVTEDDLVQLVEEQFTLRSKSLKKVKEEREGLMQQIKNLPSHIHSYLTSRGFLYSKENITNLYLSLRSKPFVIISGISGTGKTKIVQLFAEAVGATEENGQFKLISVRPDWSDSSDLLGYKNLQERFVEGQLTEIVKRAHHRPQLPHFVVLDEMNLARVEYYLSEFLSIMESRRMEGGKVVSSTLVTTDEGGFSLPNNLYIIGTVNMDETTHPFSKKVLDRVNTIEFNEIHLNNFAIFEQATEEVEPVQVGNGQFDSKYLYLKEAYSKNKELVQKISGRLEEMNEKLQIIYAQVGYRVRDEICFYMIHNEEMKLLPEEKAFDFCIMQKVLPRISGAEAHVEGLLWSLYEQFAGEAYEEGKMVPAACPYPRSAQKTAEMLHRLHLNGFTSFWIS